MRDLTDAGSAGWIHAVST
ncbi:hypothetical protein AZE42_02685 [Rhizopogon vesiculosus]|uniref:Uncharacterized protein n=1 Tax=Rhizopogon vesiculosus TaxID=180088 RepID=A0A1J8R3N8_9AGAM|nr:hypothetical protein AZE42_02685 [Rhizopogon vesiculosus]